MMPYVWIALGGALGSVARAWLSLVMVRVTGAGFPWGTILINVAGSCVIGFFATLTAGGSRYAVGNDARLFVMVGLCGGFTTFSSFSLQTFELLHDGRSSQALANIAMSVLLCLAAVAAGHMAAMLIRAS